MGGRTAHEGAHGVDELDGAHLDPSLPASSTTHAALHGHAVRVKARAVRRALRERLLLLEVGRGEAQRGEEALLVEDGDGVDHEEGKVGDRAETKEDAHRGRTSARMRARGDERVEEAGVLREGSSARVGRVVWSEVRRRCEAVWSEPCSRLSLPPAV